MRGVILYLYFWVLVLLADVCDTIRRVITAVFWSLSRDPKGILTDACNHDRGSHFFFFRLMRQGLRLPEELIN